MVEDSVMDIDMEMDLPVGGNSAMTTTATNGQQAQIQPPRTEKSRPPARMASGVTAGEVGGGGIAKPFLTSELIRELERGDVGAQTRQARGVSAYLQAGVRAMRIIADGLRVLGY